LVDKFLALAKRLGGYTVWVIASTSAEQAADGDQDRDGTKRNPVMLHPRSPDGSRYL